mmetsp:Transcript_13392/g.25139  ORF Transcript_13392/g.25139 Transcript_13392/m.25139 type:complete len:306 (+) Transcript_13392:168-1085(+)
MSLSSYFAKKSVPRKTQTINLSVVSPETGEKRPISLRSKSTGIAKSKSQVAKPSNTEDTCNGGDIGSESLKSPSENHKFTFGFVLDEQDTQTPSKAKKRRNRGKKKKKRKQSLIEQNDSCHDNIPQQVGIPYYNNRSDGDGSFQMENSDPTLESQDTAIAPPRITSLTQEGNVPVSSYEPCGKRDFVRTPPGFSKPVQQQTLLVREDYTQNGLSLMRKTPRKINKQKVSIAGQSLQDIIPSRLHEKTVAKERKLKFNPSEKGHAMVNHSSLAVRNERIEDKVGKAADYNAFSFGFTFDSLLKDYL